MSRVDQLPRFTTAMIEKVLAVTPVGHHVAVRELVERRHLAVEEEDGRDEAEPVRDTTRDGVPGVS